MEKLYKFIAVNVSQNGKTNKEIMFEPVDGSEDTIFEPFTQEVYDTLIETSKKQHQSTKDWPVRYITFYKED